MSREAEDFDTMPNGNLLLELDDFEVFGDTSVKFYFEDGKLCVEVNCGGDQDFKELSQERVGALEETVTAYADWKRSNGN